VKAPHCFLHVEALVAKTLQKGLSDVLGRAVDVVKGLVLPKMKILSIITHPHVVPTP